MTGGAPGDGHRRSHRPERFDVALEWLAGQAVAPRRVCDLGCGTGVLLGILADRFPHAELVGLDASESAAREAASQARCRIVVASLFEPGLQELLGGPFDLVVIAAVLHHVVGPTRKESRRRAIEALRCGLRLLADGGALLVVEPTFAPRAAMTWVFWAKRIVAVTGRRVELGRWNNIGAPVVSYCDPEDVARMACAAGGRVERATHRVGRLRRLPRALGIRGRWESTYVVRGTTRHPVFGSPEAE
jgi:SAM-dependent methyltransferase